MTGFRGAVCSESDRNNGVLKISRVRKIVEISHNLDENKKLFRSTTII